RRNRSKISNYDLRSLGFKNTEPTSPVPYLIDRAIRMANMNFMELLAEKDQNAVDRGREQLGVKSENYDS
ncbi:MAG: hypothetical protein ACI4NE_03900, partial [Succinivibrio sp.]